MRIPRMRYTTPAQHGDDGAQNESRRLPLQLRREDPADRGPGLTVPGRLLGGGHARPSTCVVDAATPVGRTIAQIFTDLLTREFSEDAFTVERVNGPGKELVSKGIVMFEDSDNFVCLASGPEWLEERHKVVSGTEVAVLFDACPWLTRSELLANKRAPSPPHLADTKNMWWGRYSEQHNMEAFGKLFGIATFPENPYLRHPTARLGATLDGSCLIDSEYLCKEMPDWLRKESWVGPFLADLDMIEGKEVLLEMKSTMGFGRKNWSTKVPQHYWYQVQTQLLLTGLDCAVVVCKIDSSDMRAHVVYSDPQCHEEILREVTSFWEKV